MSRVRLWFRELHGKIVWELFCLENLISVTWNEVIGINLAIVSGWSVLWSPKRLHTHIFITWEFISQLHRTSATRGLLAGIHLCNIGCLQMVLSVSANYTRMPGNAFPIARTSVTQKKRFRITVRTAKITDRTFIISAIIQVPKYRPWPSLKIFLVILACKVFAVFENAKLPTSSLPTKSGSGNCFRNSLPSMAWKELFR